MLFGRGFYHVGPSHLFLVVWSGYVPVFAERYFLNSHLFLSCFRVAVKILESKKIILKKMSLIFD